MVKVADYITDNVDIVDVISRRVNLKRAGSNFSGLSPFQNEKTASFMVSPQKQIFKDFSSGIWWNVITFVMEYEKIDFLDAVKMIAEEQHLDISEYINNSSSSKEFADEKEKIKRIHKLTQSFFVDNLKKSEKAMNYLKNNRHLSDKIIQEFGVWYAPDSSYELVQYLKTKWFVDQDLVQSSLAKKWQSDYFAFFKNRITFPIYDTRNNVVWFSARVVNPEDQPKYLNSSEHWAFNKSKILYWLNFARNNIKVHDMLIVVEWQMDVIALARLWLPIWVATSGTAVTEHHFKLIKRYTDNVYMLFDNDDAGRNATVRALKIAYRENIFPKMIVLPDRVKDADDLANEANWAEEFKTYIADAKDAFVQVYEMLRNKYDMSSPIDKQKLFNDMFSLIICVDNYTIQEHYKQVLAEKIWLPYEVVSLQFGKYANTEWKFELRKKLQSQEKKSWQPDKNIVCAALFYDNILWKYIEKQELREWLLDFAKNIWENLEEWILNKIFSHKESLTDEEKKLLDENQLWWDKELSVLSWDDKKFAHIKHIVSWVLKDSLKQVLKNSKTSTDIKQALLNWMKLL